jgi:hypothetical protein
MPNCAARKLLDLLGADVSCPRRCDRMRAMVPRVTIAGDDREASSDSWLEPGDRSRQSRSVVGGSAVSSTRLLLAGHLEELVSLAFLLILANATPCPNRGFARIRAHSIRTNPQESFNSNNLRGRILARDMLSYRSIVRRERFVETGLGSDFFMAFPIL